MYKHLFTIFFILFSASTVDAQKLYFTDLSNKWTRLCVWDPTPPNDDLYLGYEQFSEDTVLNNLNYSIMNGFFVRDDTQNRRVMININVSSEHILYDYSLEIGDTLFSAHEAYYSIVYDTDTTFIDNIPYKIQYFYPYDTAGNLYVPFKIIEGLGCSLNSHFYPLQPAAIEPNCFLCSMTNNDTIPAFGPPQFSIADCALSVKDIAKQKLDVIVYPNPVNDASVLKCTKSINEGFVIICNSYGVVIHRQALNGHKELKIPTGLMSGQYFYKVVDIGKGLAANGQFQK